MPHTIRLRGPWQYEPIEPRSPGGTIELPDNWGGALGAPFRGVVRFVRHFHRPTGLAADTRVWLVVEDVDFQGRVVLNGTELGTAQLAGTVALAAAPGAPTLHVCPARFEVTSLLQPRNELVIDVFLPADESIAKARAGRGRAELPGGPIGLVRLEIEAAQQTLPAADD